MVRAAILRTWGSTPREVGADLVVESGGALHGTVGGGCGEAEVYELALELLHSERIASSILHVDLTENPEDGGDKVCGGRFDVLVQLLTPEKHGELVERLVEGLGARGSALLATDLGDQRPGFWKEGLFRVDLEARMTLEFDAALTEVTLREDESTLFLEPLGAGRSLVIVGAGHIARPLCAMAALAGYRVKVLDDRGEYARKEYFPNAEEVVCGPYKSCLPELAVGTHVSVVLVTRGHRHDQECLRLVAEFPLEYLGMIGSRRRIDAVFRELIEEGVPFDALARVRAPVGLEIGARTPAEIAVSILAEMIHDRRNPSPKDSPVRRRRRHLRSLPSKSEQAKP